MAIEVAKVELKSVSDASGMEERIKAGQFTADQVIAVIGKTEGNGGVNDFTRILADQVFRRVLMKHGKRSDVDVGKVPMVWSGGCDGVITPHATVFARDDRKGPASKSRLTIGTAMSATLLPEDIGRLAMVEKVADAVRAAMRNAGISNPADVHYVQTKTPLLTIEFGARGRSAGTRRSAARCTTRWVSRTGPPRSALRSRSARLRCRALSRSAGISIYIRRSPPVPRASSSTQAQIVLLGNAPGAGGRFRIGHAVMRDALDIDGIYELIRNAGLDLPARPRADDLKGRVVNCFMKCEADRTGKLRGRRQIMLDDSDVHHHRHAKAAVGGVAAAALGDPAVFVSVDAMHQGPQGGGPCA